MNRKQPVIDLLCIKSYSVCIQKALLVPLQWRTHTRKSNLSARNVLLSDTVTVQSEHTDGVSR